MRRVERQQDGAVLIIALGVLTIMAVLGTAFAQLMRLERKATENYLEARQMDFLLDSSLNRVIADLQGGNNFRSYTYYRDAPWLYQITREDTLGHGRVDMKDRRVSRWDMFARRAGTESWYTTKVIDCTAQINLNSRQDTLARMLDNLGDAIERSERLKRDGDRKVVNPFYTKPNRGGNKIRGAQIVQLRRRLPGGRFTSKTQLRQLIGKENYEIVKDFVTCYGWEDPFTFKPDDGQLEVPELIGGGGAGVGGGGAQSQVQEPASVATPRASSQPRYPININTAPEEVLIAAIQGVAGRRVFPYSLLGNAGAAMSQIDVKAQLFGGGRKVPGQEETGNVRPRAIYVYTPRFEYADAKKLADRIVTERKLRPFRAWRTNDTGRPGFEDFIDGLEPSFFPSPSNAVVIDPDQPSNRTIRQHLVAGGGQNPVSRRWVRGTGLGTVRQVYRNSGRAFHDNNAWYYELAKGVLKANFNPNTRFNRYNPNQPAYVEVDKSDLVWARDQFSLFKGHTTEFTFDTNGYYEITCLGQIGDIKDRVGAQATGVGRRGGGRRGGRTGLDMAPPFERPFERRVRTVVQIFDVLRHTSQFHFEQTFRTGVASSANNRKFVQTWPEPMEALTELVSSGTTRDGRVELAGLLDGRRAQTQYQQRAQLYRANPVITLANGFDARTSESLGRLRRNRTSGSQNLFSEELTDTLKDIFDAPYSRFGGRFTKFYRRSQLIELNTFTNPAATYSDPQVQREQLGTDLLPDGLNTSITRVPHIGSKVLAYPARQRIDQGREESAVVRVGASGLGSKGQDGLGNVPYYDGGLAFWVKFEFDGDDPVFSGLVGCTQVIKEVSQNPADYSGSEGSQFFIFKNARGQLRVVRMYYHQAFLHGTGSGGGDGALILHPQSVSDSAGGVAEEGDPILENIDNQKLVSRSDLILNISHFRAHEWHHIGIDWDDDNTSQPLRLFVDFQEVRQQPILAQAEVGEANSWVRLNERQPRDGLLIGGIIREQGASDTGIFKWFTNSTRSGGISGGVTSVSREVKRMIANATIDEFVVFDGRFPSVKSYYGSSGSPGYFTNQQGEYANMFEIPLPPHADYVVLRSLDWTSYYPTTYTDSLPNSIPVRVRLSEPVRCEALYLAPFGEPPVGAFQDPWRQNDPVNRVGGRRASRQASQIVGKNAEFVYKFRMRAAQAATGNTAGGFVASPAIDDVTLTYFLPNPRIVLQETIE